MLFTNGFLIVHIAAVSFAVPMGAAIFLMRKGTLVHRRVGYAYFLLMLAVNLSILPVEARVLPIAGTGFGMFHLFAMLSLTSLALGALALRRWLITRAPEAMRSHQINLAYSYLGLMMALASELLVNPNLGISRVATAEQFWTLMAVVNGGLYGVGSMWIFRALGKGDPKRFLPA